MKPGHYVRLGVRDTGTGMDEDTRRRAIEPFFSTKGVGKGTGLGLSMVHGLAAQLGGGLTIESTLGQGTNVELWLPISGEPTCAENTDVFASLKPVGRGTALLVDDEELVRMGTADMLEELGYEVAEAISAEDALRQLKEGLKPDLLFDRPPDAGHDWRRACEDCAYHPAHAAGGNCVRLQRGRRDLCRYSTVDQAVS